MIDSRRAVSQIVGSLLMMAIVATIGSVILFQALGGINSFNTIVSDFSGTKKDSTSEYILIEHVRFQQGPSIADCPSQTCVEIWFRNTGITSSKIVTIKIINMDTQALVLSKDGVSLDVPVKNIASKKYIATDFFVTPFDPNAKYKISAITESGNAFNKITRSYNT